MQTLTILGEANGLFRYRIDYDDGRESLESKYPAQGIKEEGREKHKSFRAVLASRLGLDEQPETVITPEPAEILPVELPEVQRHTHYEFDLPPMAHEHPHEHPHSHEFMAHEHDHSHPLVEHKHPQEPHDHPHVHKLEPHDHQHEHALIPHEHEVPQHDHLLPDHSHPAGAHEHPHSHPFVDHDHGEHNHPLPEHDHPIGEHDHPLPDHDHQHSHDPAAHEHDMVHGHEEIPKLEAKVAAVENGLMHHAHTGVAAQNHAHAYLEESLARVTEANSRLGIELSKSVETLSEQINRAAIQANHQHEGVATQADVQALQAAIESLAKAQELHVRALADLRSDLATLRSDLTKVEGQPYAPIVHDHPYYADSQHSHDVGGKQIWKELSHQEVNGKERFVVERAE